MRLSTRILILASVFLVASSATLGTVLTVQSVNSMTSFVKNKSMELAISAATMLDGDSLKGMTAEDQANNTPAYAEAYRVLHAFINSNAGTSGELAYIYLCRSIGNDKFEFTLDPSEKPAEWGQNLEWTYALDSAAKGVAAFDSAPFTDEWGTFYSAYAPVFDSSHEVAMLVGIDIWANWYDEAVWSHSRSIIVVTSAVTVAGIALGFFVNYRISKRFRELSDELDALEGDVRTLLSEINEPIHPHNAVTEAGKGADVTHLHSQILTTQHEIKEYINYAKKQAYIDALTHVGNRSAYVELLKSIPFPSPIGVIVFDVDGLKTINDKFGHESGDKAIISVAEVAKSIFPRESIFRIGGDEFVVVIQNENGIESIEAQAKKLADGFSSINDEESPYPINASVGFAVYEVDKDEAYKDIFNRADSNMYEAKKAHHEGK